VVAGVLYYHRYLFTVTSIVAQEGEWSQWGQWDECSVTCGYGVYKRQRTWQRFDGVISKTPFVYEDILECSTQKSCPSRLSFIYV